MLVNSVIILKFRGISEIIMEGWVEMELFFNSWVYMIFYSNKNGKRNELTKKARGREKENAQSSGRGVRADTGALMDGERAIIGAGRRHHHATVDAVRDDERAVHRSRPDGERADSGAGWRHHRAIFSV